MILTSVVFENYKVFPGEQRLDLKPLTLVFGKNSAGKSAAVRLPLLLLDSLRGGAGSPPLLDLSTRGLDFGRDVNDLVHNRDYSTIQFEMNFSDGPLETCRFRLLPHKGPLGAPRQHLTEMYVQGSNFHLKFARERGTDLWNSDLPSLQGPMALEFEGLLPSATSALKAATSYTGDVLEARKTLFNSIFSLLISPRSAIPTVLYLGPFRAQPQPWYMLPSRQPRDPGLQGENAPALLALSRVGDGKLLAATQMWFQRSLGWGIDVEVGATPTGATSYSLVMWNQNTPSVRSNMVDTGSGMSQILPLVVAGVGGLGDQPGLLITEQPELHLHPAAHGAVADLLIDAAVSSGSTVLAETHSEMLLLRVRRRVAEGHITPEQVAIYYVDDGGEDGSLLRRLQLEEDGYIEHWPEGVFREDADEARALARAMRERSERG